MTGQKSKREPFKPLIPHISFLPYGDEKALKRGISRRTAMVIVEPIQGEAGVITPPSGFLRKIRERTDEVGALLAVDEVQTGMGRTGKWFAYQSEGITPDIITLAKGLGGGLPLGATIGLGKAGQLLQAGSHGSTFGGSPTSCAAALAAINVIKKEGLLGTVEALGEMLKTEGRQIPGVKEVRGSGLLIGIELLKPDAKEIQRKLEHRRILVNAPNPSTIRIAPALITNRADVMHFLQTLNEILGGR